jgi:hypothetical protein
VVAVVVREAMLDAARRRRRILTRLVANGRELNRPRARVVRRRLPTVGAALRVAAVLGCGGGGSLALTILLGLPLGVLLLLALLPLLADFLEFCGKGVLVK